MREAKMDRRQFVQAMGTVGALSVAGAGLGALPTVGLADDAEFPKAQTGKPVEATVDPATGDIKVNEDVIVRNSGCVGCYQSCGNRIKIDRETGRMLGVGGNPSHPSCTNPPLPFEAPLTDEILSMSYASVEGNSNQVRSTVCGRGQGTLDSALHANRITVPLKRAGKRGEGKWKPISWEQLITEVTEGGKLFEEIGEDYEIEGFKSVHSTDPIDPEQPNLGPKSNQILIWNTRADGRRELNSRFAKTFGTVNTYSHNSS